MTRNLVLRTILGLAAVVAAGNILISGEEQTWVGDISDAICGASHVAMGGSIGISDHECVIQCVKSSSKYVLITADKKVMQITNQDFKGLEMHAAQKVKVMGDLKGDAVTVTKIEPTS